MAKKKDKGGARGKRDAARSACSTAGPQLVEAVLTLHIEDFQKVIDTAGNKEEKGRMQDLLQKVIQYFNRVQNKMCKEAQRETRDYLTRGGWWESTATSTLEKLRRRHADMTQSPDVVALYYPDFLLVSAILSQEKDLRRLLKRFSTWWCFEFSPDEPSYPDDIQNEKYEMALIHGTNLLGFDDDDATRENIRRKMSYTFREEWSCGKIPVDTAGSFERDDVVRYGDYTQSSSPTPVQLKSYWKTKRILIESFESGALTEDDIIKWTCHFSVQFLTWDEKTAAEKVNAIFEKYYVSKQLPTTTSDDEGTSSTVSSEARDQEVRNILRQSLHSRAITNEDTERFVSGTYVKYINAPEQAAEDKIESILGIAEALTTYEKLKIILHKGMQSGAMKNIDLGNYTCRYLVFYPDATEYAAQQKLEEFVPDGGIILWPPTNDDSTINVSDELASSPTASKHSEKSGKIDDMVDEIVEEKDKVIENARHSQAAQQLYSTVLKSGVTAQGKENATKTNCSDSHVERDADDTLVKSSVPVGVKDNTNELITYYLQAEQQVGRIIFEGGVPAEEKASTAKANGYSPQAEVVDTHSNNSIPTEGNAPELDGFGSQAEQQVDDTPMKNSIPVEEKVVRADGSDPQAILADKSEDSDPQDTKPTNITGSSFGAQQKTDIIEPEGRGSQATKPGESENSDPQSAEPFRFKDTDSLDKESKSSITVDFNSGDCVEKQSRFAMISQQVSQKMDMHLRKYCFLKEQKEKLDDLQRKFEILELAMEKTALLIESALREGEYMD
ncbi:hypothetical protein IL306_011086 [Fusarium sp. DS 682]|nr:hypothetical protein IL306_011086 [Fusarium sp. DS 682]